MKVREIIDSVLADSGVTTRLENTCDILVAGDEGMEVRGIVTTFMATVDVIHRAQSMGANMIITHEPTFYTGGDAVDWLEGDPVYREKKMLLDASRTAVWRYHDHMHLATPDRIYEGLLEELGWRDRLVAGQRAPHVYEIPPTGLRELASFFKERLGLPLVKMVGRAGMTCRRIGILVGGGSLGLGREEMPMELMRSRDLDTIVCGELLEWTLCAYVNDARMLGMDKALIVVGHERTEEWGMKHMAKWLPRLVGSTPVAFVDAGEPFFYE
jgi:putative NIF3 family GTP cyclohydrolase 1 type 2